MIYIQHRVNAIGDLHNLPEGRGAEIDLRSDINLPNKIHLQHDAWTVDDDGGIKKGDDFEAYLDVWSKKPRGPLILNTKEDGLEEPALRALAKKKITNFLFLDTTLPTTVRLSKDGLGDNLCMRLSAMEPLAAFAPWLKLASPHRPKYVWVDCFGHIPLNVADLKPLVQHFVPILVSPDLQGDLKLETIASFFDLADLCKMICTKNPTKWQNDLLSHQNVQPSSVGSQG